ncbi:MAG TPA: MDR family MFS transporter [Polyangiaceae bacterium]|jgi:EmrB/QacA subfamily drug resistance transporter|nr:MDR family MFS transporter [Polyangiaceae bacterium]
MSSPSVEIRASVPNRTLTVAALLLSMFMAAMEATVVATAMPTVVADLGGISLYGWVGASYLLASTVTVPLYGKLADRGGRKPVLLIGIALFLAGSLASGLARTIEQLIFFRALQGLGAGAVQPIVLTVIGDLYQPSERGRVQGFFGAIWGMAGIAGPLLGGAIVHALSWRWVFLVNLPPGLAAMAVLAVAFREPERPRGGAPLDLAGATVITLASLALLLAASSFAPVIMACAGVALTVLFVFVEKRARDPVVPMPLLSRRLIAVTTIASLLLGAAMMGSLNFLPLHVQGVLGGMPTEAGLVIAPMLVGWPIASAATSRLLTRVGYRRPVWLGSAITTISLLLLAPLVVARAPAWTLGAAMGLFGVGMGLVNTAIIIGVQASVGWEQRGVATATNMFARTMGGALGVGGLGAILAQRLDRVLSNDVASALLDPHRRAAAIAQPGVIEALGNALDPLFWCGGVATAATMAALFFYPRDSST